MKLPLPLSFLSAEANAELDRYIRRVATQVTAHPTHVSQRTCTAVCGVPKEDFLEAARRGDFPSCKVRRLVLAKTADVVAWIESHPTNAGKRQKYAPTRVPMSTVTKELGDPSTWDAEDAAYERATKKPSEMSPQDKALARVGARRVPGRTR
jgi:hypothetical protein